MQNEGAIFGTAQVVHYAGPSKEVVDKGLIGGKVGTILPGAPIFMAATGRLGKVGKTMWIRCITGQIES